mgnify:FL=1
MFHKRKEITIWEVFGRLKIVSEQDRQFMNWTYRRAMLVICDCSNEKIVLLQSLLSWRTLSCWCLHKENSIKKWRGRKHWKCNTPEYRTYAHILSRCNNPRVRNYKRYWGRGIECEWKSFEEFYKDMWDRPSNKSSIDRIDNNWNYCKDNCRRADATEQQRNKSTNNNYKWKCLAERSIESWIEESALRWRVKNRWREKALTKKLVPKWIRTDNYIYNLLPKE